MEHLPPDHAGELISAGIEAYKAGDHKQARTLFARAVMHDPASEKAWLWLSGVADSENERVQCLERVLAINPANQAAQLGLAHLRPDTYAWQPAYAAEQQEAEQDGWATEHEAEITQPLQQVDAAADGEERGWQDTEPIPHLATSALLDDGVTQPLPIQQGEPEYEAEAATGRPRRRRPLWVDVPLVLLLVGAGAYIIIKAVLAVEQGLPAPPAQPIAGWHRFTIDDVSLWLPQSYEGGSLSGDGVDLLVERLRSLGPEYAEGAESLRAGAEYFLFLAFDTQIGPSGYLPNLAVAREQLPSSESLDSYLELSSAALEPHQQLLHKEIVRLQYYDAGVLLIEDRDPSVLPATTQLIYVFKSGQTFWLLVFTASSDEFEQHRATFERSVESFRIGR